ncbi:MAG: hypothetical protein MUD08_02285 [Cytophagales bacterium]|jgi:hypothetical protein|nr:hypothetical protein [Cytophagales bacterium]
MYTIPTPLRYASLRDALANHPDCIGVEANEYWHWDKENAFRFSFMLVFPPFSGGAVRNFSHPTGNFGYSYRDIEIEPENPESAVYEILARDDWQYLGIRIGDGLNFLKSGLLPHLSRFSQLWRLVVHQYSDEGLPVLLKNLPRLQSIELMGATPVWDKPLAEIKSVVLSCKQLKDITETLSVCNPQTLLHLEAKECSLTQLPADIGRLQHLKSLRLTLNNIRWLPAEIMQLEKLEELNLYKNPVTDGIELTDALVLKSIRKCAEQQLPSAARKLVLDLMQENHAETEKVAVTDLVSVLSSDVELAARKAMQALLKKVTNRLDNTFDASAHSLSLTGKINGLNSKDTVAQLQSHGIKADTKLTDQTTLVCVGDALTKKTGGSGSGQQTSDCVAATPARLSDAIGQAVPERNRSGYDRQPVATDSEPRRNQHQAGRTNHVGGRHTRRLVLSRAAAVFL